MLKESSARAKLERELDKRLVETEKTLKELKTQEAVLKEEKSSAVLLVDKSFRRYEYMKSISERGKQKEIELSQKKQLFAMLNGSKSESTLLLEMIEKKFINPNELTQNTLLDETCEKTVITKEVTRRKTPVKLKQTKDKGSGKKGNPLIDSLEITKIEGKRNEDARTLKKRIDFSGIDEKGGQLAKKKVKGSLSQRNN